MATSTKTLTPTNQTITIPDMTERPNVSLLTDGIGKEADAINALNSNLAELTKTMHGTTVSLDSYTSADYTFPSDGYLVATCESSSSAKAIVQIKDSGGYNFAKLGGWSNSTYASYSCYVKKGMKARVITLENNGHVTFEPFL